MSRLNEEDDGCGPDTPQTLVERAAEIGLCATRAFVPGKRDRSPDAARKARSRRRQRENGFVEITLKIRDDLAVIALLRRLAGAPLGAGELYAVARVLEDDWDRDLVTRLASAHPDRRRLPVDAVIGLISGFLARGELATAMIELRHHPDLVSRLAALCRERQERAEASKTGEGLGRRVRSLLRIG